MSLVLGQARERTEAFIDTSKANARLFASSTIVERYIRVEDEEERFQLMQPAVLDLFATYRQAYPNYTEIQLLLPDGYEDTRLGRPGSINLTDEEGTTEFFAAMRDSDERTHSAFLTDPDSGEPVFKFGRRILLVDKSLDPATARPRLHGYLVVTAEPPFLERQVRRERLGRTGHLILLDGEGTIIEHPGRTRIGTRVESFPALALRAEAPAGGDDPVRHEPIRFEGTLSILRSVWLHDNLLLVGVLPERELQAVSRDLARTVTGITLVIILLATVFFWILLRALVLRPIGALQRTAVAIGDGQCELGPDGGAPRDDEIGELEAAFRNMNVKLKSSYGRIHELAFKDSLTGLANRRQILQSLDAGIVEAARADMRMAVLFLDLDGFKKVNDLLGHDAGDELLLTISARLRDWFIGSARCLPDDAPAQARLSVDETRIGRLGGDEFTALVTGIGDADEAIAIARTVLHAITRPMELRGQNVSVGSSVGVSLYPDHASDADGLLACADAAMYTVKNETKNGVRLYDHGMQQRVERQARLEADLRQALDRGEFELAFQPQIAARSGAVAGLEALVRWSHPERGTVPPDLFVPTLEQTGLIGPLGAWVVDAACRQWREWSYLGLDPVRVAVNVSQKQFVLQDVGAVVEAALERHGVPAPALEVEITESCMMEAPSTVLDTLGKLRRDGVRIAMDDFGTGHSSLSMLASLPIDTLKIDRSLVTDAHADASKGSILSAVLRLARDLGLETVAEGIETEPERAFLETRDCDVLQGYLICRPLDVGAATEWLTTAGPPMRLARAS